MAGAALNYRQRSCAAAGVIGLVVCCCILGGAALQRERSVPATSRQANLHAGACVAASLGHQGLSKPSACSMQALLSPPAGGTAHGRLPAS